MVILDLKKRRRQVRHVAGAALAQPNVLVLGIEVTQAIQNMNHDVELIAGKAAVVRVYLQGQGLAANLRLRGELLVAASPGAPGSYVASANEVILRATQQPTMREQRRDAALSLNFVLPVPTVGPMHVQLKRLFVATNGEEVSVSTVGNERQVSFVPGPVLRVRVLGLRYTDVRQNPPQHFAPAATHFDHLRSYLQRAYPISRIEWSQSVIDSPPNFAPPFSGTALPNGFDPLWWELLNILHRQLLAIRQADIDGGWDPRTHYYGLVADDRGFFRGAANDVPASPAPNTVAVGPCGSPPPSHWDRDGSYGDWYGAHELAHTYGRLHPGFCGQGSDDKHFPHAEGKISGDAEDCVGFDIGDPALENVPMRAYPHDEWADFMTYCDSQWISKYTYDGIRARLSEEESLFRPV